MGTDITMAITEQLRKVDSSGNPVEVLRLDNNRFDQVEVKHDLDTDRLHVRAHDTVTDETVDESFTLRDELYKGAEPDGKLRRDVNDDIQDVLLSVGYTAVDSQLR